MVESMKGRTAGVPIISFVSQVIRGRWFMMFASFLIMASSGGSYVFGIYSSDIKKSLGYTQTTLNLIGFFKDLGAILGLISGLMTEVAPAWFVLIVGAITNFVGYFMVWLSVTGKISKPKVWQMCLYICNGANSQNFANTVVLVTCLKNFPNSRGIKVGLLKGFTGLSGAIMIQIYLAIYGNHSKSLILLIAWLPAAVSIFFLFTIRTLKVVQQPNENRIFYWYLYVSLLLALFVMVISITQKKVNFSRVGYVSSAIIVCILLFLPLAIAVREELLLWKQKKQPVDHLELVLESSKHPELESSKHPELQPQSLSDQVVEKSKFSFYANIFKTPKRDEDYTILQGLLNIDMLIIFFSIFCGVGTNIAAIDNLGQIGESLGYPPLSISTFVSLISIWNFGGRVFAGFASEILVTNYKFPRPLMLTSLLVLSSIGQILIAFPAQFSLYIASVIMGFAIGAQLALIFTIISELFGLKHYATLFNFAGLAGPLGSYVFNVRVTGKLYDKEALKQLALKGLTRHSVKELTCIGTQCYRMSFIVLAATSFFGALTTLVLVTRTRDFYKGDIYKKFREAEQEEMEAASGNNQHLSKPTLVIESTQVSQSKLGAEQSA